MLPLQTAFEVFRESIAEPKQRAHRLAANDAPRRRRARQSLDVPRRDVEWRHWRRRVASRARATAQSRSDLRAHQSYCINQSKVLIVCTVDIFVIFDLPCRCDNVLVAHVDIDVDKRVICQKQKVLFDERQQILLAVGHCGQNRASQRNLA